MSRLDHMTDIDIQGFIDRLCEAERRAARAERLVCYLEGILEHQETELTRLREALRQALGDGLLLANSGFLWSQNGAMEPLDWFETRQRLLDLKETFFGEEATDERP